MEEEGETRGGEREAEGKYVVTTGCWFKRPCQRSAVTPWSLFTRETETTSVTLGQTECSYPKILGSQCFWLLPYMWLYVSLWHVCSSNRIARRDFTNWKHRNKAMVTSASFDSVQISIYEIHGSNWRAYQVAL